MGWTLLRMNCRLAKRDLLLTTGQDCPNMRWTLGRVSNSSSSWSSPGIQPFTSACDDSRKALKLSSVSPPLSALPLPLLRGEGGGGRSSSGVVVERKSGSCRPTRREPDRSKTVTSGGATDRAAV